MMTCHDVQPLLSEFTDGGVTAAERIAVDAHLAECADCRAVLEDLQRLRRAASTLGPIAPPDHVWLQVAGQMRIENPGQGTPVSRASRRVAFGQWAGLAAALVMITLAANYFYTVPSSTDPNATSNPSTTPSVQRIAEELGQAMQHFDNAIAELEVLAKANSDALDTQTAGELRQNMQTLNAAIDESRAAFVADPNNGAARESLFEALRRKVVVLQATVNLMNEMRKGNQTGAVEAAAAFGKKS